MIEPTAFIIDIEASGLGPGSFPIEIAWSNYGGRIKGAALIRPAEDWDLGGWDDLAEAVHGIRLDQLMTEGPAAE